MKLQNLRMTVTEVTDTEVVMQTEQGQTIKIPAQLLPDVKKNEQLYFALDEKPLVSSDKHAKDILNEMIK